MFLNGENANFATYIRLLSYSVIMIYVLCRAGYFHLSPVNALYCKYFNVALYLVKLIKYASIILNNLGGFVLIILGLYYGYVKCSNKY